MKKHLKDNYRLRRYLTGVLLIIAGITSLVSLNVANRSKVVSLNPAVDIISGQDWSHMAGAAQTTEGVKIQPLGRAIVNQDGSDNQDNPPVNVRGPHVTFNNSLQIGIKASQIPAQGVASFYVYGSVPVIYDEWRYQPPQIRIDLAQQKVTIYEWNGRSDQPNLTKSWTRQVGSGAFISLGVSKRSKTIDLQVNGAELGNIKAKNLFNGGDLWFGADASIGSQGWLLQSLTLQSPLGSKLKVNSVKGLKSPNATDAQALHSLSTASSRHLPIGAAVANYALFSDTKYRQLVASQLNMLVPENELKPQFVHPQPNVYSFTEADSLVEFAQANGMSVHGHTLEFSEANPKWMQNAPLADRQKILIDHINTVVSHYGNKINEWDVVDEPLNDNDDNNGNTSDLRQNIWTAAMGESYIDTAFKAAHAANPSAKLYINEYGLEADGSRWDEFLSLIKRLQARGVPIDGVGFQAHVHEQGDEVDSTVLQKHMQTLAAMGLSSRISEIDVYGDNPQSQADQYALTLKACMSQPACTSFTMWGLTDKYGSTTDLHNYPLSYGNDLVWDENMQPKTADTSLQNTLAGR